MNDANLFVANIFKNFDVGVETDNSGSEPICKIVNTNIFFRGGNLPLNNAASADLARDKYATTYYLAKAGIKVPDSLLLHDLSAKNLGKLETFIKRNQSVFIKPNFGYEGMNVFKLTQGSTNYQSLAANILKEDNLIVQEEIVGRDYRVVILKGKILFAYERKQLFIIGDGKNTINKLINSKLNRIRHNISSADIRIDNCLANQSYQRDNILKKKEKIAVFDTTNLATGGSVCNIPTTQLSKTITADLERINKILNLTFFAVDLISDDITKESSYKILEVNSAPEFFYYYNMSINNKTRVTKMYREVLKIFGVMSA